MILFLGFLFFIFVENGSFLLGCGRDWKGDGGVKSVFCWNWWEMSGSRKYYWRWYGLLRWG